MAVWLLQAHFCVREFLALWGLFLVCVCGLHGPCTPPALSARPTPYDIRPALRDASRKLPERAITNVAGVRCGMWQDRRSRPSEEVANKSRKLDSANAATRASADLSKDGQPSAVERSSPAARANARRERCCCDFGGCACALRRTTCHLVSCQLRVAVGASAAMFSGGGITPLVWAPDVDRHPLICASQPSSLLPASTERERETDRQTERSTPALESATCQHTERE